MAALVPDLPQVEKHIVEMTNEVRREKNLPALKVNAMLAKAARAFAQKVATSGKFSHTADGRTPAQRAESVGYKHCDIAENLAMDQNIGGFDTGELALQAIAGWMNSPPHRANILRASVSEIGVGVARAPGAKPKFISVELFGQPASKILTFQIKNFAMVELSYSYGSKTYDLKPGVSVVHSSCSQQQLLITKPGGVFSSATEIAKVTAENKKLYTLKPDASGEPKLEIVARSAEP
ncbi:MULTISPECIES: CAP domain-containing protein [unclassified Hyphomicrobium]|uniref:CAP domain-containing protein n=1 Tax=unclassified Hyphomicrobium TaxID=2619925 RepID=UPI000213D871|nr:MULTISPECIES: CAP domain-containing protein [unclassified Hyphomicrobium]CCB65728.1 SCP-like extracellular [Hyphomicrobium sp. MC1]